MAAQALVASMPSMADRAPEAQNLSQNEVPPAAEQTGRPGTVQFEAVVYDLAHQRGKDRMQYDKRIRWFRSQAVPVNVVDDVGMPMKGYILPGSIRVDGELLHGMIVVSLPPHARVANRFGIPDDEAAIAAYTQAMIALAQAKAEVAAEPADVTSPE